MRSFSLLSCLILVGCPSGDTETGSETGGPTQTLTTTVFGTGRVVSAPAGIDCPTGCSSDFGQGATVVLTATPGPQQQFDGWGGACVSAGASPTCTLTMDVDVAANATFSEIVIETCGTTVLYDAGGTNGYGRLNVIGLNTVSEPTDIAFVPGGTGFLITGQAGLVYYFVDSCDPLNTVDVSALLPVADSGTEEGLLNVQFHPEFATNQQIFLYHTSASSAVNSVSRMTATFDGSGHLVLANPVRVIDFHKTSPASNHNGGGLWFAPDGTLLASVGDGGSSGNGQRDDNLVGAVVRIAPNLASSADYDYAIPTGNLFDGANPRCFDTSDSTAPCPEILAMGLRNPWRISMAGDRVFIADVGSSFEEIDAFDYTTSPVNFGWPTHEGYTANPTVSDYVDPILAYDRSDATATRFRTDDPACNACATDYASVVTGDVYTGGRYGGELDGRLLHAEFMDGFLRGMSVDAQGQPTNDGMHLVHHDGITAMVSGPDGYIYVVTQSGDWGTSGGNMVFRLVKP